MESSDGIVRTPNIIRETSAGCQTYSILDEMLSHREVECVGEINAALVYSLCRQLRHLQREDPEGEITMFINSPGGSVTDGLTLLDVMQGVSCPVRTVCLGTAASMDSLLFAAGDKRDILPHGRIMLHDPVTKGIQGSALQIEMASRSLMGTREHMGKLYAQFTGRTLEEVFEVTRQETCFDAEGAVAFGLADRVVRTL